MEDGRGVEIREKAKGEGEVQDWRRNADAAKGEREIGWGLWTDSTAQQTGAPGQGPQHP